jgi:hypothetical protein
MRSCQYESAKPQRNVKTAYQMIVTCKTFSRPYRSLNMPASQPPMADASSVTVAMKPASAFDIFQREISVGMTKK